MWNGLWFLLLLLVPFAAFYWIVFLWWYRRFMKSSYRNATGNAFWKTLLDKGLYGEYLTYRILEQFPGYKKLLANVYIPKDDENTTEIDVMMLSEAGVFVFESKNYSGWIYGDEKSKMWTQVLNRRTKIKFFNPIWQNKGHISALQSVLSGCGIDSTLYCSYIIFSERCQLKTKLTTLPDVRLIKRDSLKNTLQKDFLDNPAVLARETVDAAYDLLVQYARADTTTKEKHLLSVKARQSG